MIKSNTHTIRIKESKRSVVANSKTVAMNKKIAANKVNRERNSKEVFDLNTGVVFVKVKNNLIGSFA